MGRLVRYKENNKKVNDIFIGNTFWKNTTTRPISRFDVPNEHHVTVLPLLW